MNIIKSEPQVLHIRLAYSKFTTLTDRRFRTGGIYFGTIEEVARNLGISLVEDSKGLICSAPKARLQKFVERLHFSGKNYSDL